MEAEHMLEQSEDDKNLLENNNEIWNNTNKDSSVDDAPVAINSSNDSVLCVEESPRNTDNNIVAVKLEEIIRNQEEQLKKQHNHIANIEDKLNSLNLKLIEATTKYETVSIIT